MCPRSVITMTDGSTTVLLVHGVEDTSDIWTPVADRLRALSISCEAPGYPWGRMADFTWSATTSAGEVVLADIERIAPNICVAHSFGCLALLEALARCDPAQRPAAIVLVSPFYLPVGETVNWALVNRTRDEFANLMRAAVNSKSASVGRNLSPEAAELISDKIVNSMNPLGFITLFRSFVLLRELDLESLQLPTEIVTAHGDPGLAENRRFELTERLRARLTLHDGSDHFVHYNSPDSVVKAIARSAEICNERNHSV